MPKVIRNKLVLLPLINGVKFEPFGDYSVSEEITDEVAATFLQHAGYELHGEPAKQEAPVPEPSAPAEPAAPTAPTETPAQRKARLKAEKEAAEQAAAEQAAAEQEKVEEPAPAKDGSDDTSEGENSEVF